MNVIMPMAGRGSRFENSSYKLPKPLIEVNGIPMFIHALRSLQNVAFHQIIFIALREHEVQFELSSIIKKFVTNHYKLVLIPEVTQGQLCTVLEGKEYIDNDNDLLIISSDTIVISNIGRDIKNRKADCKGLISVHTMEGEQWSFAQTDAFGRVVKVAEKVRISDNASTGLYYFSNGKDFVARAEKMIASKHTTKGEYYVIPLYQQYIDDKEFIGLSKSSQMWDMGTPAALAEYLKQNDLLA
jgi:NDP-sugar pyrophosphorylase family protein